MAERQDVAPVLRADDAQFFAANGYLILAGFFDPARVARVKARIGTLWDACPTDSPLVIDHIAEGVPCRGFLRETDPSVRATPYKINDVHLEDRDFADLAADPGLVAILSGLLRATPLICNTLLLERGSQQPAHFDSFYMPSPTPNMMCASWIALDQVTEANGPLFYYPGSHLIPPFRFSDGGIKANAREAAAAMAHIDRIVADHDLRRVTFCPNPGDVLIWHAQLLHGGSPIRDMRQTRASLVTHYWTTLDFPDPAGWTALGPGRYFLTKPHQVAVSKHDSDRADALLRTLDTAADHRAAVPPHFDARSYLLRNLDVLRAGVDPYLHYATAGRHEGREW